MFAYTLTTLTLCCTSILIASNISKRKGTLMEYMVFIMSFSMSIGLSIGFTQAFSLRGITIFYFTCYFNQWLYRLFSWSTFSSIYCFRRNVLWGNGKYDGSNDYRNAKCATSSQYTVYQPFIYYNDYYVIYNSNFIRKVFYCDPPMLLLLLSISIVIIVSVFITFPDFTPSTSHEYEQHMH